MKYRMTQWIRKPKATFVQKLMIVALVLICGAGIIYSLQIPEPESRLKSIQRARVLKVGISEEYPILNEMQDGVRRGVEINLAYGFADFLGVSVELVPMKLTEYQVALLTREVDIIIGGLSRTLKRAKEVTFSEPYAQVTPAALVDKRLMPRTQFGEIFEDRPLQTLRDLRTIPGLKIGVRRGSAYQPLIQEWFPGYEIKIFSFNFEGIKDLNEGRIQAMVHDSLYLQGILKNNSRMRENYAFLSGGSRIEVLCAAVPFGDVVVKNLFDVYIAELKRIGQLDRWIQEFSK